MNAFIIFFLIFIFTLFYLWWIHVNVWQNQFFTIKDPLLSTHFYLGEWLLAWLLSPFDSPFSPSGNLYLLPPTSLLCLTLWISLDVPGCGEHLGNWSLARLVYFLLTPPPLLLGTSISFLPPLLYWTPWTSLSVPDCGEEIGNWLLLDCSFPYQFPLFSSWSPLSLSTLFSSPCISVNLFRCPSVWRIFSLFT